MTWLQSSFSSTFQVDPRLDFINDRLTPTLASIPESP